MKLIALFVVLTSVVGSQAYTFPWHQEHRTRFEEARDAFWEYVSRVSNMAEETLETVKQSEIGRDINERIAQSVSSANLYAAEVSEKLRPLAQELVEQLNTNAEMMRQQIARNLAEVNERLAPYTEQLQEQLTSRIDAASRSLKESLNSEAVGQELREMVQLSVEAFREKMGPYSQEVQQKVNQGVEQFQQGLVPFVEEMQAKLVQRAQELRANLAPYAEDLNDQLASYDQSVREKLSSILEEIQEDS